MKVFEIEGRDINDIESFYDEINRKLCPSFKGFGRNLHALHDVLQGGFGAFEYEEPIKLIWRNAARSKKVLEIAETLKSIEKYDKSDQPFISREEQEDDVKKMRDKLMSTGHPTLYDSIIENIKDCKHIHFIEN